MSVTHAMLDIPAGVVPQCVDRTPEWYPAPTRPRRPEYGPRKNKRKESDDAKLARLAKAVCETCELYWDCRAVAVANEEVNGVWGGLNFGDTEEREAYLRSLRRSR